MSLYAGNLVHIQSSRFSIMRATMAVAALAVEALAAVADVALMTVL